MAVTHLRRGSDEPSGIKVPGGTPRSYPSNVVVKTKTNRITAPFGVDTIQAKERKWRGLNGLRTAKIPQN